MFNSSQLVQGLWRILDHLCPAETPPDSTRPSLPGATEVFAHGSNSREAQMEHALFVPGMGIAAMAFGSPRKKEIEGEFLRLCFSPTPSHDSMVEGPNVQSEIAWRDCLVQSGPAFMMSLSDDPLDQAPSS